LATRTVYNSQTQGFRNRDQIEITKLQNELTSTRAANDSQKQNIQNELDKLRERHTMLQNELTSNRAAKESQNRNLQDELETAKGRETELRKQLTSKQLTDSSEIENLRNKLESEELRHVEEMARLKEMVRYQNASSALGEQAAEESLSISEEGRAGTKSVQKELSAEPESKHMLEEDISSSLSRQKSLLPIPPESQPPIYPSPAIQFAPIISPTGKGPEWYDSPWDPVYQSVQLSPYNGMGPHPTPTYNPGISVRRDQQTRHGEPHYELPSREQTDEIQNAPSQESSSAENLSGPPTTSSLSSYPTPFLFPTPSQEVIHQSYGTENPVPRTPNTITDNGYPFPLSILSSTNSQYYVPGPYIPTVGNRGSEDKPTELQMQKHQPEIFPNSLTARGVPTARSSEYQISESSSSYTYSQRNGKRRSARLQSEVFEYDQVEKEISASQNQPNFNISGSPEHETQGKQTETDKGLAIVEVPKPATSLPVPATTSQTTPALGRPDDQSAYIQEYPYVPPIASLSRTSATQATTVPTGAAPNPFSSPRDTIIAPTPYHLGYARSENTTASHSYSNLSETNYSPRPVPGPTGPYQLTPETTRSTDKFLIPQTTSTGRLERMAYEEDDPMECHSESPSQLLSRPSDLPLITLKIIREGGPRSRTNPNTPEIDPCGQGPATTETNEDQSPGRPLLLEYKHIRRQMFNLNENDRKDDSEDENDDEGGEYKVDGDYDG